MTKAELRDHQKAAIEKMHNGCVLWGGTGTGKTITALAYAQQKAPQRSVVIVTTAKVRDSLSWEKEAAKLLFKVEDIEVTSWNKINDMVDYEGKFFIFDEQRLVGSGAWVKAFYKIARKNKWILLSATPGDTWSDYAPMFIANGWYKNITEFRREHAVYSVHTPFPKIERYINEGRLVKYRKLLLVEMPMERHTTRHMHYVECDYDKETLDTVRKKRWNVYEDKPLMNAGEMFNVMRKVVSTDPSRTSEMVKIIAEHPKLIVFYNFNYELEILRSICKDLEESEYSTSTSGTNFIENNSLLSTDSYKKEQNGLLVPQSINTVISSEKPTSSEGKADLWLPNQSLELATGPSKSLTSTSKKQSSMSVESEISKSSCEKWKIPTFSWAEWNGHKHQEIPQTDRWVYLVQYNSGSEGWNCTETDSMAFWSLTYSWKQFWQAQGRTDRLNTPFTDLHYYVLLTNSFAEKPVIRSLETKHDFQPR